MLPICRPFASACGAGLRSWRQDRQAVFPGRKVRCPPKPVALPTGQGQSGSGSLQSPFAFRVRRIANTVELDDCQRGRRRVVVDGELHGTPDIMSMVLIRSCCAGGSDMLQGHCVRSIGLAGWKLSDFSDDPACPDPLAVLQSESLGGPLTARTGHWTNAQARPMLWAWPVSTASRACLLARPC